MLTPAQRGAPSVRLERLAFVLCLIYLVVVAGVLSRAFAGWAYDDPFITYRYAENLAHGSGFVYNAGVRVLSTTTPMFAMLLALCALAGANLPQVAVLIGIGSVVVGAWGLWDLAKTQGHPAAGWVAVLLYPIFSLLLSTLGSETPLYLALGILALAWHARGRYTLGAAFAALATLARPDGLLVFAVLAVCYALSCRTATDRPVRALIAYWRPALVYICMTGAWFAFAWIYFGNPLPATLAAKQAQGLLPVSQSFLEGLYTLYIKPNALAFGFAVIGLVSGLWRRNLIWMVPGWALLYFLGYSVIGVTAYFWYYAPLTPGLVMAVGLGVEAIYRGLLRLEASRLRAGRFMFSLAVVPLCVSFILWGQVARDVSLSQSVDRRASIYRATGEWLLAHTAPDSTVATLEIGIIGFYAQRTMIDFAGLAQPDIARALSTTGSYEDAAVWAVNHYRPDYVVLRQHLFPRLEQQLDDQHCVNVQTFAGASYGYDADLFVLKCSWP